MPRNIFAFVFAAVALLICGGKAVAASPTESILHSFGASPSGNDWPYASPFVGLTLDSAGNIYGTTTSNGLYNHGVVFKLTPSGTETVLYNFTGGTDGSYPDAGVILDAAGNVYGTAEEGGTSNQGVVFKIDTAGHETVLYNFTSASDGGQPQTAMVMDAAGNLYGGVNMGGSAGKGGIFKLTPSGAEVLLYSFTSGFGTAPAIDSAGNLYWAEPVGGTTTQGQLLQLDPLGNLTVLSTSITGSPYGALALDQAGNFYGVALNGGEYTLYQIDPQGNQTVMFTYLTENNYGYQPTGVAVDSAGNVYGSAYSGGQGSCLCGLVFEITAPGHELVLYNFQGAADGGDPVGGVTLDAAGNVYGLVSAFGPFNSGGVFMVGPNGTETLLGGFPGGDGAEPSGSPIRDAAGNLYGTTRAGGLYASGAVFKMDAEGNESVLYSIPGGAAGSGPYAGVILDSAGNLYGTTEFGGTAGSGVVFKVSPSGEGTVLYSFAGGTDGKTPLGDLALDAEGNLYGTTEFGGTANFGTVFKISPSGTETILYNFTGKSDGGEPWAGVITDASGNLYGTTLTSAGRCGVIYKLTPSGAETVLYSLSTASGCKPKGGLIFDSAGNLYGTASTGGAHNKGTVFQFSPAGQLTVLHSFPGGSTGSEPLGNIAFDTAGNIYGIASGGNQNMGIVFELLPSGAYKVLHKFLGGSDGDGPQGGVVLDSAGNVYGVTGGGGSPCGNGVVYKIRP